MKNVQKLSNDELIKELEEIFVQITTNNVTSEIFTNKIEEDELLISYKEKIQEEIENRMQ